MANNYLHCTKLNQVHYKDLSSDYYFLSISNIFMTDSQQTPKKKKTLKKVNKTISFLRKLQRSLLRAPLGTIYKSFMKTYIDYSASSTSLK